VDSNQNVESKTKNVESKIAFGQLILRKILKTVATRCQILRLKCTKIQKSAGAPPQTPLGSLQRSPDPLAGPTSKRRGGDGMGGELGPEGRGGMGGDGRGVLWSPKNP